MYDFDSVLGLVWPALVFWVSILVVVVLILMQCCCYWCYVERRWRMSWIVVLLMIVFVSWDVVADDDYDSVEML